MARPPKPKRSARAKPPLPPPREPMTSVASSPRRTWMESGPEIDIAYAPVGRETMAAITAELASNAPDFIDAQAQDEARPDSAADRRAVSRDTMDALTDELLREHAETPPARKRRSTRGYEEDAGVPPLAPATAPLEVFEMLTFVVRGADIGRLASPTARRVLVAERLLHRLPTGSLSDVERIDVTPWTDKGTVVVRIWCKIP